MKKELQETKKEFGCTTYHLYVIMNSLFVEIFSDAVPKGVSGHYAFNHAHYQGCCNTHRKRHNM